MRVWDRFLTDRDRAVFDAAGYGAQMGFGHRPAVLVIDVNRNFCGGDEPRPILETLGQYRNSCGLEAWDAVDKIAEILVAARAKGIPVVYSTVAEPDLGIFGRGRWADKNPRNAEDLVDPRGNEIVAPIAPVPGEIILRKNKPSIFFGTTLAAHLVELAVDSLLVCGTTTSGCVRGTVVDAFSLNYKVTVIEDATFDRGEASHAINLFDMSQKYADVRPTSEVVSYLQGLGDEAVTVDLRRMVAETSAAESNVSTTN